MAILRITDLKIRTRIGVYDWEKLTWQDILINIELTLDDPPAAQTDRLNDTVDYKSLCKTIIHTVESSQFELIERLVDVILDLCLEDTRVRHARVRVDKPRALRFARSVSIEMERRRS